MLRATVDDNADLLQQGAFSVTMPDKGPGNMVKYVSPYQSMDAGFVMIPEVGTEVIIAEMDDGYYYMGSVYAPPPSVADLATEKAPSLLSRLFKEKTTMPDPDIYAGRGVPQQFVIKTPRGAMLKLSDLYNPEFFNCKAELRSATGKFLTIDDSPLSDSVKLMNQHGDGLTIYGNMTDNATLGAQSLDMQCVGTHRLLSRSDSIIIRVDDGREIDILNTSTGTNQANGSAKDKTGNINVESYLKDINLTVGRGPDAQGTTTQPAAPAVPEGSGRVFIEGLGKESVIQVDSNGRIIIHSSGDLEIRADKIKMFGKSGVDIKAGAGSVNIDGGSQVHLNDGNADYLTTQADGNGVPIANHYGDKNDPV